MGRWSRGLLGSLAADVARAATLETVFGPFGMLNQRLLGGIAETASTLALRALSWSSGYREHGLLEGHPPGCNTELSSLWSTSN